MAETPLEIVGEAFNVYAPIVAPKYLDVGGGTLRGGGCVDEVARGQHLMQVFDEMKTGKTWIHLVANAS